MLRSCNSAISRARGSVDLSYFFYICDTNGEITYASSSQEKILGYSRESARGVFSRYLTGHPMNREGLEKIARIMAGEAQPAFELEVYDAGGGVRYLSIYGYPYCGESDEVSAVYGIAEDITPQKRREESLYREQMFYKRAEEMAKIGSWSLDIQNNRLQWSDEIYRIFEIDPEHFDASYEAFLGFVHPDDFEATSNAYIRSLEEKTPYSHEHRLLMRDGRIKHVREECETFFDEAGEPLSSFGTVQDVTAVKELQIEHEINQELMFQQSKMAQMGEMINSIAHQWRQPLHQINSILPSIEEDYLAGTLTRESLSKKLDEIELMTEHMSQTVESFKEFFNPNKRKAVFSIGEVLKRVFDLFRGELERGEIGYTLKMKRDITVYGSEKEFVQAMLTIINNARECFSHRDVSEPRIWVETHNGGPEYVITVSDNGGGIPDLFVDRIFDPYFTTKREGHGTGLGLYIAKKLIETGLGGTLSAANGPEGAVFTIRFPRQGSA